MSYSDEELDFSPIDPIAVCAVCPRQAHRPRRDTHGRVLCQLCYLTRIPGATADDPLDQIPAGTLAAQDDSDSSEREQPGTDKLAQNTQRPVPAPLLTQDDTEHPLSAPPRTEPPPPPPPPLEEFSCCVCAKVPYRITLCCVFCEQTLFCMVCFNKSKRDNTLLHCTFCQQDLRADQIQFIADVQANFDDHAVTSCRYCKDEVTMDSLNTHYTSACRVSTTEAKAVQTCLREEARTAKNKLALAQRYRVFQAADRRKRMAAVMGRNSSSSAQYRFAAAQLEGEPLQNIYSHDDEVEAYWRSMDEAVVVPDAIVERPERRSPRAKRARLDDAVAIMSDKLLASP